MAPGAEATVAPPLARICTRRLETNKQPKSSIVQLTFETVLAAGYIESLNVAGSTSEMGWKDDHE
jgi:hypothetical protein